MGFHSEMNGLDLHAPSFENVTNNSGSSISSLTAVKFTEITNGYPLIEIGNPATDQIRGITISSISNGSSGKIICIGLLHNIDTSSFAVGDVLYIQSNGSLSTTATQYIAGEVLKVGSLDGIIYIKIVSLASGSNYTDTMARSAVGGILQNTASIDLTYDSVTPKITADLNSTLKTNYDSAVFLSHEQNTDTGTNASSFSIIGTNGLILGEDKASGTANTAGKIKLWSAGDNAYSTAITTGTQTDNINYTLPTSLPTVNGQVLSSTTAGVLNWTTVSGGGGGDIYNGGQTGPVSIGTTDNTDLILKTYSGNRMYIKPDGRIGIGDNDPWRTSVSLYDSITAVSGISHTSLSVIQRIYGPNADSYNQGLYCVLCSCADAGETHALLRNYIYTSFTGDGTVTEMYGCRTLASIADNNSPTDISSGVVQNMYGLEAYANNTSTGGGRVRNATGILISHAKATGSDSGHNHVAIGIDIVNDIFATGGDTNTAYAIRNNSVAPIYNTQTDFVSGAGYGLKFECNGNQNIRLTAPLSISSSITYSLPATLPTVLGFLKSNSSGTMSFVEQNSAISNLATTWTANGRTATGSITIADGNNPTVAELAQYCCELEAKIETLLATCRTFGIIAS